MMPRQFKIVGTINEGTKVLGSTHGEVKKVLEAGFEHQFVLQKASEAKRIRYAQVMAEATPWTPIFDLANVKVHDSRIAEFASRRPAITGGAARMARIRELVKTSGLDKIFISSVLSPAYEKANVTFVEKAVQEQLDAGVKLNVRLSRGQLLMSTGHDEALAPSEETIRLKKEISR